MSDTTREFDDEVDRIGKELLRLSDKDKLEKAIKSFRSENNHLRSENADLRRQALEHMGDLVIEAAGLACCFLANREGKEVTSDMAYEIQRHLQGSDRPDDQLRGAEIYNAYRNLAELAHTVTVPPEPRCRERLQK